MRLFWENLKRFYDAEYTRHILWLPVLFGVGIGLFFSLKHEPSLWLTLAGSEILFVLIYLRRYQARELIWLSILLVMVLGFADIQLRTVYQAKKLESLSAEQEKTYLQGRITAIEYNAKGLARLVLTDAADFDRTRRGLYRVTLRTSQVDFAVGQCVEMAAALMHPSTPVLPNGYQFDRKAFFEGTGAVGYSLSAVYEADCTQPISAWEKLRYKFGNLRRLAVARIYQLLPEDRAGVAAALVAGDRQGISAEMYQRYRDSGLAHLLAISGLHMGLIAAIAFFVLRLLMALVPALALRFDSRKPAAVFAILMSLVYLLISGMAIPGQRAFIMTSVVLIGILFSREAVSMRMVALAAMILLVISPQILVSAGFQMSFAAVVVLIAFYERYAAQLRQVLQGKRWWNSVVFYIAGLLIADLVASLATLPFTIYHFNQVAVYTLVGNLLAGPIVGFVIMPFVLLALFLMPLGFEALPLQVVGWGIAGLNEITMYVAGLPGAGFKIMSMPLWGLLLIVGGGLWLCLWQLKWRRWGLIPIALGMLSILTVSKPDMLYDQTGETVAVLDNQGNMVVMPERGNMWLKNVWLEKTVSLPMVAAEKKELQQIYNGEKTDFAWLDLVCNPEECVYKDIVRWRKDGQIVIDGVVRDTAADAGGAVYVKNKNARVETVRESVGFRAWNN